ncbi:MAG: hypothetical protein AAF517_09220, partial [Planctomycetota bacterium]
QWLVDWRSENRRRRARAVAYLRRRLAPQRTRDGIGIDLFDCEFPVADEVLRIPELARELHSVWKSRLALPTRPGVANALLGLWVAGDGFAEQEARAVLNRWRSVPSDNLLEEAQELEDFLRALGRIGSAAASFAPDLERIRNETFDLTVRDAAVAALRQLETQQE